MPATIRSRCQRLDLPTPGAQTALDWLALVSGDEKRARRALAAAAGKPLSADELLRDDDALQAAERRQQALSDLFDGRGDPADAIGALSALEAGEAVQLLRLRLHAALRELPAGQLRSHRVQALLSLDADLRSMLRAIAGGATPQRDLLASTLVTQLHGLLGDNPVEC